MWHNADFTITLTATDYESGVAETYYRINNRPVKFVSVGGHPLITTESANNTLEYWSVDNAGNEEIPHKFLTGIKLDTTSPVMLAVMQIPGDSIESDQPVRVLVNVTDALSGVKDVTLSYCIGDSPSWTDVPMTLNATYGLYEGIIPGQQVGITVKYRISVYDNAGNSIVEDNNGRYYVYTVIPEFPSSLVFFTLMVPLTIFAILLKKEWVRG